MLLPTPLVSCSVSAPPNPPPPAGRHRALLPTWNLMDTGTPTLSAGGVGAWSWDHTSRQRRCPPGTARSLQGLGFPCWDGRGGFCREKEQRGLCGGDVRRQLPPLGASCASVDGLGGTVRGERGGICSVATPAGSVLIIDFLSVASVGL